MSSPIQIAIASETKAYKQGIDTGVIKPTEDAEKALKEFGRAGDKSGEQLEKALRDAQKESDDTRNDIERMADAIEDASRKSRDFGGGMKAGTAEAGEAVQEWGDEAKANISETFSSFRGEAEDFVGIVQDTFGGVISNLGPVGMAAGAAGALGIGLLMGAYEKAQEAQQEFREQVAELAGELIDVGGDPADAVNRIAEGLKELASNAEEGELTLAGLRDAAETSASGFRKIADAYAGNTKGLSKLVEAEREYLVAAEDAYNADKRWDSATTERLRSARDGQRAIVEGLEQTIEVTKQAEAEESAWLNSNGPAYEARAEYLETIQGELDSAIGSWSDYQDAETGATDPGAYIAAMQARMDATSNFSGNVAALADDFGLSFEAQQAILDQGVDFAPMLQSIIDAGLGEQYATQIQAMLDGGQAIIDGTPTTATVEAKANTDAAAAALNEAAKGRETTIEADTNAAATGKALDTAAKDRTTTIKAKADTAAASQSLNALASRPRTARIGAYVDLYAARAALNAFVSQPRTATVTVVARTPEGKPVP